MERISHATDLSRLLQQKLESDRLQIEALTSSELKKLAQNLSAQSRDALNTTLDAIKSDLNQRLNEIKKQIDGQTKPLSASLASVRAEASALQRLTVRAWLKPLLTSAAILLSVFAGSWGLMQWLSSSIEQQLQTRAQLQQQIAQQQQTLAQLQQQTFGIELMSDSSGRYIVLPRQTVLESGYKVGNRDAYKLLKK